MKKITLILVALFASALTFSQTIVVGGRCMSGSITLTYAGDEAGKPSYVGTGTVLSTAGVVVSIFWIGAPDNVWVLAFDGQPYFSNPCNTPIPPGTSPNICAWAPVPGNDCLGATPLSISGAVVLPVGFTKFTATAGTYSVELHWTTAQETNNRGFSVQRSSDGQVWSDIGFTAGAANTSTTSNYRYTDRQPAAGINFYRLRQQDYDGQSSLSAVVEATISSSTFFTLSDNPGRGLYQLKMPATAERLDLLVTDATGRVVHRSQPTAGNQLIDISRQAQGVYWLIIKKGTSETRLKLIKL